jgi:hypothetical protein
MLTPVHNSEYGLREKLKNGEFLRLNSPIDFMRFTLIYDGPLPAQTAHDSRINYKQEIRNQLHPQLAELWTTHPALHKAFERWQEHKESLVFEGLILTSKVGNFRFLPLVTKDAYLLCELDILFLRYEPKGNIVNEYGDLDNRLKVLFDALRMPKDAGELPALASPPGDPFFVLLQDDSLITGFRVNSEKLLQSSSAVLNQVRLVINVTVKVYQLTYGNMALGGD